MTLVSCPAVAFHTVRRVVFSALVLVAVCGCATRPDADPRDPWESFNRGVFSFNDAADKAIFKPAAIVYRDVTPSLVRAGVTNFFGNLEDAWSFVNSVLQLKLASAVDNFMRFNVNTVFGIGGIFDVASEMRIERHREDFGQTLGRWGVAAGPYLVLPLLGPSTLRDTVALPVDFKGDIAANVEYIPTRNSLKVLDQLDTRASLLSFTNSLDEVALDKYSFTRDAFLQRRNNAVFDGNPPEDAAQVKPATR
jgi:phospholipid-binding lipoprotein MlaA